MWLAASVKIWRKSLASIANWSGLEEVRFNEETITGTIPSIVYHHRDSVVASNHFIRATHFLDDLEAGRIVSVEDVRTHEREDWHDVVQHGVWRQSCQIGHQNESLVEGLRVIGD